MKRTAAVFLIFLLVASVCAFGAIRADRAPPLQEIAFIPSPAQDLGSLATFSEESVAEIPLPAAFMTLESVVPLPQSSIDAAMWTVLILMIAMCAVYIQTELSIRTVPSNYLSRASPADLRGPQRDQSSG